MKALGNLSLGVVFLLMVGAARSQVEVIPGSARRGEEIFTAKGCVGCHAIDGQGGTRAPDLGRRAARLYSPNLLASAMWNHGPAMWEALKESGQTIPPFTSSEAADLYSYFYSRLYFSSPGEGARGRRVFADKHCVVCHALDRATDTGQLGPPVSDWARVRDPIIWAERMWNHAGTMYAEMDRVSIRWPELTGQDMADLLVYLQGLPTSRAEQSAFELGEPEQGLAFFSSNCEGCHSFGPSLPGKIDLLERPAPLTMTDYVASMWSHAPQMAAWEGDALPNLEDGAMSDLIAYLFTQRYFSETGNVEAGALAFWDKGCMTCHELERNQTGAPDLTQSPERHSPITMTRALWNHGPEMLESLESRNMEWPMFEGTEMADLIAYLNSRLVNYVAGPESAAGEAP